MSTTNTTDQLEDLKASVAVDMASLDDLYADNAAPKPAVKEPPADPPADPSPEEPAKEPADAKPAQQPKAADKKDADDDEPEPADVAGLKAALKATRQKARERKAEVAEEQQRRAIIELQLAEASRETKEADARARHLYETYIRAQQQQAPQPPDPLTDPEGALAYRDAAWANAMQQRDAAVSHQLYMSRVVPSQHILRERHADYDEMETLFAEAANTDPGLWAAIKQQEFPAKFAYEVGKEIKQRREIQAAGSFDQWIEQKVAEKLAAAQAQPPSSPSAQPDPQPARSPAAQRLQPPQSLARVPSVTPRNASKSYSGPTPLSDLYKT